MKNSNTARLIRIAVFAGLAAILSVVKPYKMPLGGSISIDMVPIFIVSFYSWKDGIITGICSGLVSNLFDPPVILHPVQFLLDYPVAFGVCGIAGLLNNRALGVWFAGLLRTTVHIISGYLFFSHYFPVGTKSLLGYSVLYNFSYMLPSIVLCWLIIRLYIRRADINEIR